MHSLRRHLVSALAPVLLAPASLWAAPPTAEVTRRFEQLQAEFQTQIQPLAKRYCLTCHSTAQQEGELDLERFAKVQDFRPATGVWLKVAENLDNGEMPPKDARQPSPQERKQLREFVQRFMDAEALASAGDPGPVVLRRLSNAEYTYTIRDLTGVPLSPAKEFPVDSAAGEGFTNTGNALVMSPALLTKYFDAAKGIADHAVLLPDGFRWSVSTTRSDWTNELLAQIREFYARYSAAQGGSQVNLQGIVFNTNDGGRLPVEQYLAATLNEREALETGRKTIATVAQEQKLNAKYLGLLWQALHDPQPTLLLQRVQQRWKSAQPADAQALAAEISQWQNALVKFRSVGHMKSWMQSVEPLVPQQEVKFKIPAADAGSDVELSLVSNDLAVGTGAPLVEWLEPRLVAPGRPDLPLKAVRGFVAEMSARRTRLLGSTTAALTAAAAAGATQGEVDRAALAKKHQVDLESLNAWFDYLGVGGSSELKLALLTNRQGTSYEFVKGWSTGDLPNIAANSSGNAVRIPGNMKAHGVVVHPTPTVASCVGWRSPIEGVVNVVGAVTHAHPECGNGVTWSVELRRGATRQKLASGIAQGGKPVPFGPVEKLAVRPGDLISLLIGPRDANHSCDLTDLELEITPVSEKQSVWSLTADVSPDIQAGNPHADRQGNAEVWHFYSEPVAPGAQGPVIPAGSLLAKWQGAADAGERNRLAAEVQKLLTGEAPADPQQPDAVLRRQLVSLGGPLLAAAWKSAAGSQSPVQAGVESPYGVPAARFGTAANGVAVGANSLVTPAKSAVTFRLPADLAEGAELVAVARVLPAPNASGAAQFAMAAGKQEPSGQVRVDAPIVFAGEATQKQFAEAFERFRELFPAALCYTKIVPVDEVVTLTLFHREDEPLQRLMLDERGKAELDRLWNELHFVAHDALTLVDAFAQLMEYATQDSDPGLFEPYRKPIHDRAAAFRQELVDAEPKQLEALIAFAGQAYRRPLKKNEEQELRALYRRLREQELPHDEAFRFTLARLFVSPAFLYRLEKAPEGAAAGDVSADELASRLSYFLWSSQPDASLREAAAAGRLTSPDELRAQARRMLQDGRVRRLATEFACQWLHIYDFDTLDEKSERHFPEFAELRGDMYEEAIAFLTDLFQRDGSVGEVFDADHTFVNVRLAKFYGLPDAEVQSLFPAGDPNAAGFRRLSGVKALGRGGVLGLPATLAKQSGASRTSPILRGNWVSEVLLGERLPRPPKDVPVLPEDEAQEEKTVRQLVEQHSSDPRCANCHVRIDPLGFALEGFDPIGRRREKDLAGRPIDAVSTLGDGTRFDGLAGLRQYLVKDRRSAIQRQFCKKLLGYSLGRGVQLSDEPLLAEMQAALDQHEGRFSAAVEVIVSSPQFRQIRGRDAAVADAN